MPEHHDVPLTEVDPVDGPADAAADVLAAAAHPLRVIASMMAGGAVTGGPVRGWAASRPDRGWR